MTPQESKVLIHATVKTCHFLGLNKNNWREFKLAYDMTMLNRLGK